MATQQIRAQQLFRYRSFHINKSQPLGHGSYGAVYKAKCDQLPCAAKVLHPTILDPNDPGAGRIMQRFQQECAFLENIRHPNIVQYLGMTRDPESRLPVLLMELLDQSLTKMLEHSQRSLAYYVQVDICHDIALAVAYLHSNDIIHRDLSSNNVLIMAKSRAKVTDFGMSKLAGAAPSMTPLTMCPGTVAYMPPEALDEPPVYTKKLDCFSEGVIMIQVCTRLWPEPGSRTRTVQDSRSPTGTIKVPVLEPERRKNHIDMIDPGHGLLPVAVDCLHYQENERPSSEELCQMLAGLKETREYRESVEQVERVQNDIAQLERQMREIQVRETTTVQQLQELRDENQQLQQRYHQLESEIQSKDSQLKQKDENFHSQLQEKNEQIQSQAREIRTLSKQLEEQEHITAEIQQTESLQRQQLSQQSEQISEPPQPPLPKVQRVRGRQLQQDHSVKEAQSSFVQPDMQLQKSHPPTGHLIELQWRDGGKIPYAMARGAAVVNGNVAYFMGWNGHTCSYDSSKQKWSELPRCPHRYGSLAVIRGLLTAIGGLKLATVDNKLLSMTKVQTWVKQFPPMPSKRSDTAVVSTKQHLIVAGGKDNQLIRLDTVEVMDIETLVWSIAAILPHPYSQVSATICGDQLYMLGGFDKDGRTKSVLTCSLMKLLQSCSETSPGGSVWHRIADVPVYSSTCAAVNGELVAVGGEDAKGNTSSVHKYNPTTNSWEIISNMETARYRCLVAVLPTNEMMVVGGYLDLRFLTDKIETAVLYQ